MTPSRGPDALSWAAAFLRGLDPLRWAIGLLDLAVTVTIVAGLHGFWEGQAPRLGDWFGDPVNQALELRDDLARRSFVGLVIRLGVLLAVLTAFWAIVGAWIARHELVARHRGQPYATPERVEPGPTGLVAGQLKGLATSFLIILCLCILLLIPVGLAGLLNRLGGVGALLVAIVLPVVLVADLVLLLIALGAVAWPLMPVTIAAENSDTFDALSRAYNYAYQRPVRFVLLTVATLVLAAAPLALVLFALAGPIENWPAVAGHPAAWIAGGLSVSIYWSVQTLAYLDLRAALDETDAYEIARDGEQEVTTAPALPGDEQPKLAARKQAPWPGLGPIVPVVMVAFMVVTWVVTAWLFARVGGENSGWLAWGLDGRLKPEAEGLYFLASVLAGGWGFLWLALPIATMLRRAFRRAPEPAAEPEARSASGEGLVSPP